MPPKRVGRPSGWLVRFARDQVRLILALDETLRQGAFDPTTDAVPAGYETFRALWNSDETNQYGLVRLPDESDIVVTAPCRGQIPHYLVLPRRNEDEMRDPATYQRLMGIAVKTLLRGEEHKSSRPHPGVSRPVVSQFSLGRALSPQRRCPASHSRHRRRRSTSRTRRSSRTLRRTWPGHPTSLRTWPSLRSPSFRRRSLLFRRPPHHRR
ncbi:hypothetical protein BC628DRAFT_1391553 [Trametes gibbosa]|nr:hypothetical protein BC628DRAFT_1391553 [Trametes gibbosa]